jgi:hypothetical protein
VQNGQYTSPSTSWMTGFLSTGCSKVAIISIYLHANGRFILVRGSGNSHNCADFRLQSVGASARTPRDAVTQARFRTKAHVAKANERAHPAMAKCRIAVSAHVHPDDGSVRKDATATFRRFRRELRLHSRQPVFAWPQLRGGTTVCAMIPAGGCRSRNFRQTFQIVTHTGKNARIFSMISTLRE